MNSPISSEVSTFVDQTPSDTSKQRLLDDFLIDDSETSLDAPLHIPLLYQPSYSHISTLILAFRIANLCLNFLPIIFPLFDLSDAGMVWLPLTIPFALITFLPFLMTLLSHKTYKSRLQSVNGGGTAGQKRVAVLVEDPRTGEERWMLEKRGKEKLESRGAILGLDIFCGVMLVLAIVLTVVVGRREESLKSHGVMWGIASVKAVMLVLLGFAACVTFSLAGKIETEG